MSVDAHLEGTRDVSLRQTAWEAISLFTEEFHLLILVDHQIFYQIIFNFEFHSTIFAASQILYT